MQLAGMTSLRETPACNEIVHPPEVERFIEIPTALIIQYEDEIEPDPERSPSGVLKYLMEEHGLREVDLVPLLGGRSYISQILSGHRPISKAAAQKPGERFHISPVCFL
jgi:HTH-type transcriptional regulator/antitoxin HigA